MNRKIFDYRTTHHPHGNLVTNSGRTLAFVRIAKCASTTFAARHKLKYWDSFSNHKDTFFTFCALRNPRERFLSSIAETVSRLYSVESEDTKHLFAKIPVSNDVFMFISNKIKQSGCFIKAVTNAIEEYGFFDSHHEPMVHFLINKENQLEINPITINVTHIDILSQFIYSLDGTELKNALPRFNASPTRNMREDPCFNPQEFINTHYKTKGNYIYGVMTDNKERRQHYNFLETLAPHILQEKSLMSKPISWAATKLLIYNDVIKSSKFYKLEPFLEKYYSDDMEVFKSLEASCREDLTPQNLISSLKRFKEHIC